MSQRVLLSAILAVSALASVASSQTLTGFDAFEWTFEGDVVSATGVFDDTSMTVVGPDGGCSELGAWYQTGPLPAGRIQVTVAFTTADFCHYDWPLFVLDGEGTPIAEAGSGSCYGTPGVTIMRDVPPGSTIGLGVGTTDCIKGAGTAVFTDISFVPTPGVFAFWYDEGHALDPRLLRAFPPSDSTSALGFSVLAPGDLDGDGTDDVVLGGADSESARVVARSGATGAVIWDRSGPFSYGFAVAALPDVDGDGVAEVAVSTPFESSVELLSGADGALLWTWTSDPGDAYGRTLSALGDLDGDGASELAVGRLVFGGASLPVPILSGADGSLHAEIPVPAAATALFGLRTAPAGDVDADGTGDLLVSEETRAVWVFSGADGSTLHMLLPPQGLFGADYAAAFHGAGDVDGDGHADVLVSNPTAPGLDDQGGLIPLAGAVALIDGASGAHVESFYGTLPEAHFGATLLGGVDVDDDGTPDMVVGVDQIQGAAAPDVGGLQVRSLADDATLFELVESGTSDTYPIAFDVHAPTGADPVLAVVERLDQAPYPASLWSQLTHPGAPRLNGGGAPLPGELFTLKLRRAPAFSLAGFVLGASTLEASFKGGVLVPTPDKILFVTLDDQGVFGTGGVWPASVPPEFPVWVQAWVQDPAGPSGYTASRALRTVF